MVDLILIKLGTGEVLREAWCQLTWLLDSAGKVREDVIQGWVDNFSGLQEHYQVKECKIENGSRLLVMLD